VILSERSDDAFVDVVMEAGESDAVFFFESGEFGHEFVGDGAAFVEESDADFIGDGLFVSAEEYFVDDLPGDGVPFEAVVEGFDAKEVEEAVESASVVGVGGGGVVFEEAIEVIHDAFEDEFGEFDGIIAVDDTGVEVIEDFDIFGGGDGFFEFLEE
jgi:hypothetical protein